MELLDSTTSGLAVTMDLEALTPSINISQTTPQLPYSRESINILERYYIWGILILGFPGNFFSIITIMRMSRFKSSTFYVAALATVDNIALALKASFMELQYHPNIFSSAGCKLICFLGLLTAAFSNWILVAMASERFMAVRFPLKVASMWTLKRAVMLTLVVLFVLSCIHLHLFWTIENNVYGCKYVQEYTHFTESYWYWLSASLYAFIPCIVLILFNFLIIHRIQRSSKLRRQLTVERSSLPPATAPLQPKRLSSAANDNHITVMLVSVTVVFVILTIPRCAVLLIIIGGAPTSEEEKITRQLLEVITSLLADSNHAINFFLYFIAGRQFRYHFIRLFIKRRQPQNYVTRKTTIGKEEEQETVS